MNRDLPTLRVLATGLDEELSLNANSEAIRGPQFENNRQYVHNPNRYLFSQLDFVFFFSVIGSLLAFVFTYDAISGEHRRGILRLLLINPISRPLLLTAKFLGSYLSLITSLLPAPYLESGSARFYSTEVFSFRRNINAFRSTRSPFAL